jgi:hypothetical protein
MNVRLKSRRECPPSGFLVSIGTIARDKQFWSFAEAVAWFHGVAVANPHLGLPTDPVKIENYIDTQNAVRVLGIPGAESYVIKEGGPGHWETKKATLLKPVVAVGGAIKQLAAGAEILREWLGEGAVPVARELAEARAETCVKCPENGLGDLTRWFTTFTSESIRKGVEALQKQDLKVVKHDKLGICNVCLCPLKLKVFTPLKHITPHLSAEVQAKLPAHCWMVTERKS